MFNPDRHEALNASEFNPEKIRQCIHDICSFAIENRKSSYLWESQEDENPRIPLNKTLYFGASGSILSLARLSQRHDFKLPWSVADAIENVWKSFDEDPDFIVEGVLSAGSDDPQLGKATPSYFLGSVGVLLARYVYSSATREQTQVMLEEELRSNLKNPTLEPLWAGSGTVIAACFMWSLTKGEVWKMLIQDHFNFYWAELESYASMKVWNQKLYESSFYMTGAGHGFVGNLFPFFKAFDALDQPSQDLLLQEGLQTILNTATVNGDKANWVSDLQKPKPGKDPYLVQWCHGSPGFIVSLDPLPVGIRPDIDELLVKAGNLVWEAGPLKKKAALCHGTDGNGYAFLKMYRRTNDSVWLSRARQFAMHAMSQRSMRSSTWNGDLGLALYLDACLQEDADFPFLDWI
ncbi:lanthionine synthetase C family protein [Pseudobacteriovorax antillogorgiicola]|uniref:Lanthionine synthetase C-like protein n=1 Tax=Pseudobacteriovorax antillogorgiicola TaxID=1513793 RepID=A0A1Y6CPR2_9BACT|nr:LanC-like protein [Pseudobacteriovorax antillogorgiicola]TCS42733.1 lanthionine synthetase-like protein [Pseudobacteriovorax antillogorgiicola]SMF82154.1 Lanthionine synthetase C-like protein [Pseudobacteriovorax antillogorgiicola]